jgi:hypothetical protein
MMEAWRTLLLFAGRRKTQGGTRVFFSADNQATGGGSAPPVRPIGCFSLFVWSGVHSMPYQCVVTFFEKQEHKYSVSVLIVLSRHQNAAKVKVALCIKQKRLV